MYQIEMEISTNLCQFTFVCGVCKGQMRKTKEMRMDVTKPFCASASSCHLLITCIWSKLTYDLEEQLDVYTPIQWLWSFGTLLYFFRYLRKLHIIIACAHFLPVSFEAHESHLDISSDSAGGWVKHASETDTVYWLCCVLLFPFHFHHLSSNVCHTFTYIYYLSSARSLFKDIHWNTLCKMSKIIFPCAEWINQGNNVSAITTYISARILPKNIVSPMFWQSVIFDGMSTQVGWRSRSAKLLQSAK